MQKHVLLSLVLVACTSLAVGHPAMQRSESHRAHPFNYPIAFQINAGQVRPEVKFLSQQQNYRLFLTPHDAVFTFSNGASQTARLRRTNRRANRSNPDFLRLHLLGASVHANPEGRKTLPSSPTKMKEYHLALHLPVAPANNPKPCLPFGNETGFKTLYLLSRQGVLGVVHFGKNSATPPPHHWGRGVARSWVE
jgi:hypothetical protein